MDLHHASGKAHLPADQPAGLNPAAHNASELQRQPIQSRKHVVHYPLNGLDLPFSKYVPARYGPMDIMANHMIQDMLFPARTRARIYHQTIKPGEKRQVIHFRSVSREDKQLGLDMRTLSSMLLTTSTIARFDQFAQYAKAPCFSLNEPAANRSLTLQDAIHDVIQRFYLERDRPMRRFLREHTYNIRFSLLRYGDHKGRQDQTPLNRSEIKHLKQYSNVRQEHHRRFLYSGHDSFYRRGISDVALYWKSDIFVEPCFTYPPPRCTFWAAPQDKPRSKSVPASSRYSLAEYVQPVEVDVVYSRIIWKSLSLSELDHRTRRRSLSRRHVSRMFLKEWELGQRRPSDVKNGAFNHNHFADPTGALDPEERRFGCVFCAHCDAADHTTAECPIPARSRCKCSIHPRHTAKFCRVRCSRPCGNEWPPGHAKHRNAMSCKARCCMCGIKGHSGLECKFKTCRCGGKHLGQDCSWHPTCRVEGCDRYLCGVHCRECGSKARPFVGRRCQACLKNGQSASPRLT